MSNEVAADYERMFGKNIADAKGLIMMDFALFQPYGGMSMDFWLEGNGKEIKGENFKINHRYPNPMYFTISQKSGRKVSKFGYYFEAEPTVLNSMERICFSKKDPSGINTYCFPIQINLQQEKRFASFGVAFAPQTDQFYFMVNKSDSPSECWEKYYTTDKDSDYLNVKYNDGKPLDYNAFLHKPNSAKFYPNYNVYEGLIEIEGCIADGMHEGAVMPR